MDPIAVRFIKRRNLLSKFSNKLAEKFEQKVAEKVAEERASDIRYYTAMSSDLTPEQAEAVKNNIVYASRLARKNGCRVGFFPSEEGSDIVMGVKEPYYLLLETGGKSLGKAEINLNSEKSVGTQIKEGIEGVRRKLQRKEWGV